MYSSDSVSFLYFSLVDLIPGDTSTKAKENCDTNETGERVFHSETERVSPDGGVGSPKALKDADHSPSEEKPAISEASIKVQPPTPTSPKEVCMYTFK